MSYIGIMKRISVDTKPINRDILKVADSATFEKDYNARNHSVVDNLDKFSEGNNPADFISRMQDFVSVRTLKGPYEKIQLPVVNNLTRAFANTTAAFKTIHPDLNSMVSSAEQVADDVAKRAERGAEIARSLSSLSSGTSLSGFSL